MAVSDRAGKPAEPSMLVDVDRLIAAYYDIHPDPSVPAQAVSFGTSGPPRLLARRLVQRGSHPGHDRGHLPLPAGQGIDGPLFIGRDSHALSEPATRSAIEVLVANGVSVLVDSADGLTPTPSISHAILTYNRGRDDGLADGIVVTPSHNPPEDGGFKYNPPNGGPADTDVTGRDPETRPTSCSRPGSRASAACPTSGPSARSDATTSPASTSPTWPTSSTWRPSAPPASSWAWIRSAARASATGPPSATATAST